MRGKLVPRQQPCGQLWATYDNLLEDFVRINAPLGVVRQDLKGEGCTHSDVDVMIQAAAIHEDWWADTIVEIVTAHRGKVYQIEARLLRYLSDSRHCHYEMGLLTQDRSPWGVNPCSETSLGRPERCVIAPPRNIAIREILMPKDLNHHGVAFGGWVLSKMDLAGAHEARQHTQHDVVTRYMNGIAFTAPILPGDVVTVYTGLVKIGRTSITVKVEVEASRDGQPAPVAVTGAEFVYVTIQRDAAGNISKVPVK